MRASTKCARLTPFLQATREARSPVGMPMACQLHIERQHLADSPSGHLSQPVVMIFYQACRPNPNLQATEEA